MKKFENFCKSLVNLEEIYNYKEPYNNVTLTGLVGLYEICFEQSWKAMKEILYQNGIETAATGSPKAIIKEAYSVQMIVDQEVWIKALADRNNVAHAYNEDIAHGIIRNTRDIYVPMFRCLKETIENNWL